MTLSFSNQAILKSLTSSVGEVSSANDTYTVTVPKGTSSVALKYTIADQYGLLYINDKLVDDTREQNCEISGDSVTLNIKVYAEDHTTVKNYQVVVKVKADAPVVNLPQPTPPQATPQVEQPKPQKKKASISIVGKKTVKKGKSITLTVKKKNITGKAKWSVNKKKLAKLKKKSANKVILKARKKGKVKVTVKVGKVKKTKKIKITK